MTRKSNANPEKQPDADPRAVWTARLGMGARPAQTGRSSADRNDRGTTMIGKARKGVGARFPLPVVRSALPTRQNGANQ